MSKRKKKSTRRSSPRGEPEKSTGQNGRRCGAPPCMGAGAAIGSAPDGQRTPKWIASEGNLYCDGRLLFHLAAQAHAQRAILNALEKRKWLSPVRNPLPREVIGDATQSRRSVIKNLNRNQGKHKVIQFFSMPEGFVFWCSAEYLRQK